MKYLKKILPKTSCREKAARSFQIPFIIILAWLLFSAIYTIFANKDMVMQNTIIDDILMWFLGFNLTITLFVFVALIYSIIVLKQVFKKENFASEKTSMILGFILSGAIILVLILLRFIPYRFLVWVYFG